MNDEKFDELLAARALHALDADEERMLDAAIAADDDLRRRAAQEDETAALLAEAIRELEPPSSVREALLAQIGDLPQHDSHGDDAAEEAHDQGQAGVARPEEHDRRPRHRTAWTLAASIAVIAGIAVGGIVTMNLLDGPPAVTALDEIEQADDARSASSDLAGGGTVELHWSQELDQAVVTGEDIPVLDDGQQYELWIVRDETPVSAGLFDGGDQEPVLLGDDIAAGDVVAVTVEDEGGSPTGAPTTEPVVAVEIT
ncbi:anti-sigma factor [Microbacterium halophytorum]|uniref:anti-sigma factor n=1 Tax=Microbacterium halophytorum TaxID=2067568 RepID=UPI000CFE2B65|nr:anti-sigma factor [Microbacterium halophytorum]